MELSVLETIHILYNGFDGFCKDQMATNGAKKVLELVKNTEFDVIIYDVIYGQCFYSYLEVSEIEAHCTKKKAESQSRTSHKMIDIFEKILIIRLPKEIRSSLHTRRLVQHRSLKILSVVRTGQP